MPIAYNPSTINWGSLSEMGGDLGTALGPGQRQAKLREELASIVGPNGITDWNKAYSILAKHDPVLGLKFQADREGAQSLAGYRNAQASVAGMPEDARFLQWAEQSHPEWFGGGGGGAEPSRLSPAERSSGLSDAPAMVQKRLMSLGDQEAETVAGKARGDRAAKREDLVGASVKTKNAIANILKGAERFDTDTFENALGPWQGMQTDSWMGAAGTALPQTLGAIKNYWDAGPKFAKGVDTGTTGEVRRFVHGGTNALIQLLKPYLRTGGEGSQSDIEFKAIASTIGELSQSKTKEEFYRGLGDVVDRLNSTFGMDVSVPQLSELLSKQGKIADRFQQEPAMDMATEPAAVPSSGTSPAAAAVRRVQTVPIGPDGQPMQAGAAQPPPTEIPGQRRPVPAQDKVQLLRQYANDPEAIKAFDEIYGAGAADHFLQGGR